MLSVASCHGNRDNLQPWDFWITLPHLSFRKHCCPFLSSWSSRGLWIGKTLDTRTKIRWPVERHARARKVFTSCGIWKKSWGKRRWYGWIVDEKLLVQKPRAFFIHHSTKLKEPLFSKTSYCGNESAYFLANTSSLLSTHIVTWKLTLCAILVFFNVTDFEVRGRMEISQLSILKRRHFELGVATHG